MPSLKPKMLTNYPPSYGRAVHGAIANPGIPQEVEGGLSRSGVLLLHRKLTGMRNGLKQFEVRGSPLQLAAENQLLKLNKVQGDGDFDWSMTITFEGHLRRPSDIAKETLADYYAGRRSTPF